MGKKGGCGALGNKREGCGDREAMNLPVQSNSVSGFSRTFELLAGSSCASSPLRLPPITANSHSGTLRGNSCLSHHRWPKNSPQCNQSSTTATPLLQLLQLRLLQLPLLLLLLLHCRDFFYLFIATPLTCRHPLTVPLKHSLSLLAQLASAAQTDFVSVFFG